MRRPRLVGAAAVLAAGGLGAALLAALGAPARLVLVNLGATVVAALLLPLLALAARHAWRRPTAALVAAAAALWATALWGADLEGVRRWARIGPLLFHVGFLVLPLVLAVLSRAPWAAGLVALAAVVGALAAQPDGGSALALAAGAAALALGKRSRLSLAWAAIAGVGAVSAWLQPDPLAAVPFVEGVAALAVERGAATGLLAALALGLPWLLLALVARARAGAAAAGFWFGATLASLVGNFPTPIAGAGVTPILAYALTWALLAARPDDAARTRTSPAGSPGSAASAR